MGFRCSLLGHDYGDSEVDRDREERGDEVVVTVHEFRTCDRCGKTKTVSENKEVTSIAADENVVDGPGSDDVRGGPGGDDTVLIDDGETGTTGSATNDREESADTPANPTEQADDAPTATETGPAANQGAPVSSDTDKPSGVGSGHSVDEPAAPAYDEAEQAGDEPVHDDAIILDADDETDDDGRVETPEADHDEDRDDDREYGEWPEHEQADRSTDSSETAEWPDAEDEGHAAVPPDDGTDPDVEFDDGELVPGATAYPDEDAQIIEDDSASGAAAEQVANEGGSTGTGITSSGSVPTPDASSPDRSKEPLVCPECEMTASSRDSLRQGDICPECKRGYLTERERNR